MLLAFTIWFQKVFKTCLLLIVALPNLIALFCPVAGLKIPAMIVYDVATKVLDTEMSPQHTIADLNLWHCIYCFVQSGEAFMAKGNKHARTSILIF